MPEPAVRNSTEFKSNHYVPRFLLDEWCVPDPKRNNEPRLRQIGHRPHVGGPRVSPKTPRGVACIDDLYSVELADRVSRSVERDYFGPRIDTCGSQAHVTLVTHGVAGLDEEARMNWAYFLCAQMVRTPMMVKLVEEQVENDRDEATARNLMENLEAADQAIVARLIDEIGDRGIEQASPWLINIIASLVQTRPFRSSHWLVRDISHACSELLLGDNPLILSSQEDDSDFICALPITPRKLFLAANNETAIAGLTNVSANNLVKETNRFTVTQASTSVFATNDKLQHFVVKHLRPYMALARSCDNAACVD